MVVEEPAGGNFNSQKYKNQMSCQANENSHNSAVNKYCKIL